ncbi:MAG TPA: hypothetical protein P5080_01085 [Candidatus Paceibacterota bacterium]|nr:hypothetical protein [Candidatus Pacearchaeota archaeon]HRZ50567.1 hypothetical protein [Candidatus Paceibacterota bacterium]HSA36288.1 hypothetical protein [Candidatus Paceibacterota bacterium]
MDAGDILVLKKAREFSKKENLEILSLHEINRSENQAFSALTIDDSGISLAVDWIHCVLLDNTKIEGSVRFGEVPKIGDIIVNFEVDTKNAGDNEVIDLMTEIMSNIKAKRDNSLIARERALSQI